MEPLSKDQIRKDIKLRLRAQSAEDRERKSRVICQKVFALGVFRKAQTVMCYASFDGEVDTQDVWGEVKQHRKILALPKVSEDKRVIIPIRVDHPDELEHGAYGIKEPCYEDGKILSAGELDLVIVPALAYDKSNYRLGRGAGYYDRFLSTLSSRTITIGLAFDFQIIDSLPSRTSFDQPVSLVVTN